VSDALTSLGISHADSAVSLDQKLRDFGFAYIDLDKVCPALNGLIQLRSELGLRSCANTLAKMLNPFSAEYSLQGVYHRHLDEKHASVAQRMGESNVLCFRGDAGEVEFNPERECELHWVKDDTYERINVPAINEDWVCKPRELDPKELREVWCGRKSDYYGNAAVIGTMSLMLIQIHNLEWMTAQALASEYWCSRQTDWTFS
jgi:anthranilate phosphoribosyltransferase